MVENAAEIGVAFLDKTTWSDPLIQLQVDEYKKFVVALRTKPCNSKNLHSAAERLCEWSRSIHFRTFGRINRQQATELDQLFRQTSSMIQSWDLSDVPDEFRKQILTFAKNISDRVDCLPQ